MHEVTGDFKAYKQPPSREASACDHQHLQPAKSQPIQIRSRRRFYPSPDVRRAATASPIASELVRPGLSMPNSAISPSMP